MSEPSGTIESVYEFGQFRLSPSEHLLLRDERPVALPPKVFDTLVVLVENAGRLIEKDELLEKIWADTFVEEATLARNVSLLRKVLQTDDGRRFIETVPKRGYRFVEPVRRAASAAETHEKENNAAVRTEETAAEPPEILSDKQASKPPASAASRPRRPILWFLLIAVGVGGLVMSLSFWRADESQTSQLSGIKSIAVLPFKPIRMQERDESLELGMADALITRLGRFRQIVVRPTNTVAKYLDAAPPTPDPVAAARELKVEAILDGSIQRQGERMRVTARLLEAENGLTLWSDTFDTNFTDIFAVQDSISEQIVQSLHLEMSADSDGVKSSRRETADAEAYGLYLKGRFFWNKRTEADFKKAIEFFEQAIAKDPNYALAYVGIADSYLNGGYRAELPTAEIMARAKNAALKALEIDDSLAEAHASLAFVKLIYEWNFHEAGEGLRHSLRLNPNYATAHQLYSEYLSVSGRHDEAIAAAGRAQELDPTSLIISRDAGRAYYFARQPDRAIEQYRQTLEMNDNFSPAVFALGLAYLQKDLTREAVAELERADRLLHGRAFTKAALAYAYARDGRRADAEKILAEFSQAPPHKPVPAFDAALVHTALGQTDEAFRFLQKACEERFYRMIYLKSDPLFDPLRADPRFDSLLGCVGLP
jgi:DNA-binding winged helix-turn-helix (wHTH) protein/TolB-like protein/Tfp pilus assembly protein PilF